MVLQHFSYEKNCFDNASNSHRSSGSAQERRPPEATDTLKAAVKVDDRVSRVGADAYRLDPVRTRRISSPLGEGDAVKYIQTLPGVAMGGEGGSAFYVRGGNMGSNLMTLDGVPVYGVSHLLGFTTIFPQDAVDETVFQTGGVPVLWYRPIRSC